MDPRHRPLPSDIPVLFRGADAVAQGVLTPAQLRGPYVRRVLRGVYSPIAVPLTHELRCEAAGLVMRDGALLTGRSAATVAGVQLAGASDDVEVLVPEDFPTGPRRGLLVRRAVRMPTRSRPWRTTTTAPPFRVGFDLAARWPLPTAVAHLDRYASAGHLDHVAFAGWLEGQHCPDVVAVRAACDLVDVRSESVPESVLRVHLVRDGLEVQPQHEVRHHGRLVARVDLALVELRIAIEYDGVWHVLREQLERDRDRLNRLQAAGWIVVHVTASMLQRPDEVLHRVREAVALTHRPAVRRVLAG